MRLVRPFVIIGAGAFAAGIFYSKSSYDHRIDEWLLFAMSIAIAVGGLADLLALALRGRHQPLWLK